SEEILRKTLREQEIDIIAGNHFGGIKNDSPENLIVNELINFPEIDYDEQTEFLFKLANSAVNKFRQYLNDVDLINVVQYHKSEIGRFIYQQMMEHFYVEAAEFEKPVIDVKAFTKIEDHNYSKFTQDQIHDFKETINPASAIPTKIFTGFRKTYHLLYKFDSKTEKDFSIILEQDNDVEKWLRPAHNQFRIYWAHNSKQYHPDFVVEGKTAIYIIETKKLDDMNSVEVNDKARAAIEYCKYASEYTSANDGKPWKYVQIPHNAVQTNMSFKYLVEKFERR
ncbi:MAG: hypothetical protein J5I67_04675, partial [Ignavibacterium album]|nr:hypothetical protein [Ignavibacterium album]